MWKHWFLPKCPHLETGSKWGLWRVFLTSAALQRAVSLVHVQFRCDFCLTVPVHFHPWCYELKRLRVDSRPFYGSVTCALPVLCNTQDNSGKMAFFLRTFFFVCLYVIFWSRVLAFFNLEVVPGIALSVMEKWRLFAWDSLTTVSGL